MSSSPGIRAGWPKLAIRFVKALPPPAGDEILGRIGPARVKIRSASFLDYVEIGDFIAFADATLDVLGLVPARELWRNVMLEALRQPAVGELVRRAGVDNDQPAPLLERTADAFRYVHRDCGRWIVEASAETRSAVLTLDSAPSVLAASASMAAVYWGNVSAVFVALGVKARVAVFPMPEARRVLYKAHW